MMPESQPPGPSTPDNIESPLDTDVMIGRIVDGEASLAERDHFERLAAIDAAMWRRLALRQQDAAMLVAHVEPALNRAEHVELPKPSPAQPGAWRWWMAASGWAALIAVSAIWFVNMRLGSEPTSAVGIPAESRAAGSLSPQQHLEAYLRAPFVLGEMQPTLLQVEQLPDGRYAMSYLRRIVEVSMYDSAADIPAADEGGNLLSVPNERDGGGNQP